MTEWEIHGNMFVNCNCAYGCPCQFNALPTYGNCEAIIFVQISNGHFGTTKLDDLNMAFAVAWPGAVHQGGGTMQPIIDERGTGAQRKALLDILTGRETDPMMTAFAIYTAMCDTVREPVHTAISIGRAACEMPGARRSDRTRRANSKPRDEAGIPRRYRAAQWI